MKFIKGLISILLLVFITSCISYRYIDLQVLNPGSVKLPSDITFHIINPQKIDSEHLLLLKDTTVNKLYYYKLLIHTFDSTLKARFSESPMFENSRIVLQNENDFQKEMARKSSVEKTKHILMTIQKMDVIEKKVQMAYDSWNYWYEGYYSFIYKFKMELQNIGNEHYYDTAVLSDTITWTSSDYYRDNILGSFPSLHETMEEIGGRVAQRYATKIAPFWNTEERVLFYSSNKYMRKGYNLFVANDLEGAIQSWKHLYEVGTSQLASGAAHNIGLAYEMLDDFENAELWLNNSIKLKFHFQTDDYLDRIRERKAGRKILDEEMK